MGRLQASAEAWYRPLAEDIFAFARELGVTPTKQQAQLLDLVQKETFPPPGFKRKGRIAVKSGQGPGKTKSAVIAGLWRSFYAPGALSIVTAPSMRQCRDVYLTEARRTLEGATPKLKKLIEATRSRIEFCGDPDWGIKTVTAKDEVNAQGYHEENMTWIVEEASGVDRPFIEQIKGTLSNENALLIMIGNPNTNDCSFHDCFSIHRDLWHCLTFNAEDTARDYPHILSPTRNRLVEIEFGKDSDVYRVRVLGEFPHSDPNCVMAPADIEACTRNNMYEMATRKRTAGLTHQIAKQYGIDLARFGSDESVIAVRQGNAIIYLRAYAKREPVEIVEAAFVDQSETRRWSNKDTKYVFDVTGLGQGVGIVFRRSDKDVFEFNNGAAAFDSQKYDNKITEAWFHLRRMVIDRACYLPPDPRLIKQLSTRQYFINKKGKIVIESKEDYKKRGFESPDRADAVVLAFYDMATTGAMVSAGAPSTHRVGIKTYV